MSSPKRQLVTQCLAAKFQFNSAPAREAGAWLGRIAGCMTIVMQPV